MDLRGINEIRPDRIDAAAADAAGGGPWLHACSHADADGGAALAQARGEAAPMGLELTPGGSPLEPLSACRLLSASVRKLRVLGCGVARFRHPEGSAASAGWDGGGWLGTVPETG